MKVTYDNSLKVGGIGISPWTRLGPERWFPHYKIASFFPADEGVKDVPPILSIYGKSQETLSRYNSVNLLKSPAFQKILEENFTDYQLFTYKSAEAPAHIEKYIIRMNKDIGMIAKQLENKAAFRRLFAQSVVRFPQYSIHEKKDILTIELAETFLDGRKEVVLQDAELSGGKGTFFINDQATFLNAKKVLAKSASSEVVISEVVPAAKERSVQCVATQQGIFMGPPQIQIIDEPLLINRDVVGAEKFCGVVVDERLTTNAQKQAMYENARVIGEKIASMGYQGIFGIDFLVDDNGEVFVLEVNPRITGATPLLTAFYSQKQHIPFYLLHILETMKQEYRIEGGQVQDISKAYQSPGSLMILHSQEDTRVEIVDTVQTGIYSSELVFKTPSVSFDKMNQGEYLIQSIAPVGVKASPAARLLTIYYKGSILDEHGVIIEKVQSDIEALYKNITLIEATEE